MARTTNRTEAAERLGRARRLVAARKKVGLSRPKAVEKTGININTLKAHESGRNGFSPSDAKIYAKAYETSEQHLLYDSPNIFISFSSGADPSVVSELAKAIEELEPTEQAAWSQIFLSLLRTAKRR